MRLELVCVALGGGLTQGVHRVLRHHREDDLAVVVGAAGESRSSHITYRTHGRPALFRRKWRHAWPLPWPLFGPFRACRGRDASPSTGDPRGRCAGCLARILLASTPGLGLTPRVAICGRDSLSDNASPGGPIVRLGTP